MSKRLAFKAEKASASLAYRSIIFYHFIMAYLFFIIRLQLFRRVNVKSVSKCLVEKARYNGYNLVHRSEAVFKNKKIISNNHYYYVQR